MGGLGATRPWRAMFAVALTALALGAAADAAADEWTLEVLEPAGAGAGAGAREGGELQLSAGQALRLRCEGPERPRWLFPAAEEGEVDEPLLPKVEEQAPPATPPAGSAPARWAATLHLPNASYYHTGAYACVRHAHPPDSLDPPKPLVDIYVYVADPKYPWARAGVVPTRGYEQAVRDCRPNNRSLHVKLLNMFKEVPMGLNENRLWSPTLGFTLGPINLRNVSAYFCKVVLGAEDDLMLLVMVNTLRWTTTLIPPRVQPINAEPHAVLGKDIELQCYATLMSHVLYSMKWLVPANSTAKEEGRLNATNATEHFDVKGSRIGSTNLTIVNVTENDAGAYACLVEDHTQRAAYTTFLLDVKSRSTNPSPPRVQLINAVPYAVVGKQVTLRCYASLMADVPFSMEWLVPANSTAKEEGRLNATKATARFNDMGSGIGSTNLIIVNVTENDAGSYTCLVQDHSKNAANTTFYLEVKGSDVPFIEVNTPSADTLQQRVGLHQTATWPLEVVTYPKSPFIIWYTPAGIWLREGSAAKFRLRKRERGKSLELTLSVLEVELSDRGTYALKINTGMEEKTVNLTLTVLAAPLVQLQAPPEPWTLSATRKVTCTALGSPLPTVQWAWHPCSGLLRNCAPDVAHYVKVWAPVTTQSDVEVISTLELLSNSSGFVTCRAANELDDSVNETISLQVTDMPGPRTLEAWGPEAEPAVEGDDLRLWCGALRENHTEWPHWRRSELWDDKRFQMTRSNTTLSLRSQLRINPASVADSGSYLCSLDGLEETTVEYQLHVKPQRKVFPRDVNINNTEWMVNTWDKLIFRCDFDGLPRPTISWYKDSEPFAPPGGEQFRLQDGNQTLVIGFVTEADQGEYRCRAANRLHSEERWVRVQLHGNGTAEEMVALTVVLVVLLLSLVALGLFVYKGRKRRRMCAETTAHAHLQAAPGAAEEPL